MRSKNFQLPNETWNISGFQVLASWTFDILNTNEILSIRRQLEEVEKQIQLTRSMLGESESLAKRGLTPRMRILELQRIIASLQSEREQVTAALFKAERSNIQASQEADTLEVDRKLEVQSELGELEDKISTLQAELRTAQFVTATMPVSPEFLEPDSSKLVVRIVRNNNSRSFSLEEAERVQLQPGDLLMIEMSGREPETQATVPGATSSLGDYVE